MIAAFFGTRKMKMLAQRVQKRGARIERKLCRMSIHYQLDGLRASGGFLDKSRLGESACGDSACYCGTEQAAARHFQSIVLWFSIAPDLRETRTPPLRPTLLSTP
jgi:hypothetical protein